jgi:hypothetical protein
VLIKCLGPVQDQYRISTGPVQDQYRNNTGLVQDVRTIYEDEHREFRKTSPGGFIF